MRLLAAIWLMATLMGAWAAARAQPAGPDARPAVERHHDAIAVIIGNRRYAHGIPEVRYAANDAAEMKRFAVDVLGYRVGNVIGLVDASQAEMFAVFGNSRDHRGKLGGFKRSSQHFGKGGCDEYSKATFGPVRAGAIAVTWSAAGGGTCRPAAVLVCDRGR